MIDLQLYILVSVALFAIGLYAVVAKTNSIQVLIGVEFMTNAAIINFVAFGKYDVDNDGQMMALFVIVLAAVAVAVALAIIINVYKHYGSINPQKVNLLKDEDEQC